MKKFSDDVYMLFRQREFEGTLCSSATANKIMELAKPYYQQGAEQAAFVVESIEQWKKQPGVPFPVNYEALLEAK